MSVTFLTNRLHSLRVDSWFVFDAVHTCVHVREFHSFSIATASSIVKMKMISPYRRTATAYSRSCVHRVRQWWVCRLCSPIRLCLEICAYNARSRSTSRLLMTVMGPYDRTLGHLFPVVTLAGQRGSLPLMAARRTDVLRGHLRRASPVPFTMHGVGVSFSKTSGRDSGRRHYVDRRFRWRGTMLGAPLALR